jgi:hypothetical protein
MSGAIGESYRDVNILIVAKAVFEDERRTGVGRICHFDAENAASVALVAGQVTGRNDRGRDAGCMKTRNKVMAILGWDLEVADPGRIVRVVTGIAQRIP